MAGAIIKVEIEDSQAQAMFARLLRAGVNMLPLFTEIGSALEDSTKGRFLTETDPDGNPWADLSPVTLERKRTSRKLYERGDLYDSVRFEAGAAYVDLIVGPTEYAATQHYGRLDNRFFGGPLAPIPARPIVGISAADSAEIDEALSDFLEQQVRG